MVRSLLYSIAGKPGESSLNHRIFNSFLIVMAGGFAGGSIFVHIIELHPMLRMFVICMAVYYTFAYYVSRFRGWFRYVFLPSLGFGVFGLSALWFLSGGLEGSPPLMFLIGMVILVAVVEGRYATTAAGIISLAFACVVILETFRPDLIIAYPSNGARRADLIFTSVIGFLMLAVIIGLLRRNYEAERTASRQMNQQLVESERGLITARDVAEKASRSRTDFLSTMSHEIRTPLNSVVGMTHLLLEDNPRPDQLENLRLLRFAADNLLVLLNDILDFNKIEAGKVLVENSPFPLPGMLDSLVASIRPRAEQKGLKLDLEVADDVPPIVLGDSTRLSQVLMNLVSNAVKFTESGQVKVSATPVARAEQGVEIEFRVRDTGIGIPKDKQEVIFEAFAQAATDTTRRYGGTGLGLAITRRLLELMHSGIKVESEVGKGSEFSFILPFEIYKGPDLNSLPLAPLADLTNAKILLVEDYEPNVILARRFLSKWGALVDVACNGREGIEKVAASSYDLILMDLQMPEVDGFEATRAIRAMGNERSRVPIIALTAAALPEEREKARIAGMTDYITKPFDPRLLHESISRLIRKL
ncbi:MAG: response regulator [Spirochaetia bacterium]|nr:response regulator [Spirochaetia bacterium]